MGDCKYFRSYPLATWHDRGLVFHIGYELFEARLKIPEETKITFCCFGIFEERVFDLLEPDYLNEKFKNWKDVRNNKLILR